MNRRNFLKRLVAAGIVGSNLDLIEKLTCKRRFFPGWSQPYELGFLISQELLDDDLYSCAGMTNGFAELMGAKPDNLITAGFRFDPTRNLWEKTPRRFEIDP